MLMLAVAHGAGRAVAQRPPSPARGNRQKYQHSTAMYGAPEADQDAYWPRDIDSRGIGRQSGSVRKCDPGVRSLSQCLDAAIRVEQIARGAHAAVADGSRARRVRGGEVSGAREHETDLGRLPRHRSRTSRVLTLPLRTRKSCAAPVSTHAAAAGCER